MSRRARMLVLLSAVAAFASAQELKVVATNEDLAWFARRIGGDSVQVEALSRGDQDPHRVAAKPSFLIKLKRADVLVQTGLDMEHAWLPALLDAARNDAIRPGGAGFVNASEGVRALDPPGSSDRSAGVDFHPRGNPHFLLDPEGGRAAARNLAAGFARVRPAQAEVYRANLVAFEGELERRLVRWAETAAPLRGRAIAVRHGAWSYLAARYGFRIAADLEPMPGVEPTPTHVAKAVAAAREAGVVAVVVPNYARDALARRAADDLGVPLLLLPVGATGREPFADWFACMETTLKLLAEAAAKKPAPATESRPASRP
jgi:zinc/manganese transport system substrate-binding protein